MLANDRPERQARRSSGGNAGWIWGIVAVLVVLEGWSIVAFLNRDPHWSRAAPFLIAAFLLLVLRGAFALRAQQRIAAEMQRRTAGTAEDRPTRHLAGVAETQPDEARPPTLRIRVIDSRSPSAVTAAEPARMLLARRRFVQAVSNERIQTGWLLMTSLCVAFLGERLGEPSPIPSSLGRFMVFGYLANWFGLDPKRHVHTAVQGLWMLARFGAVALTVFVMTYDAWQFVDHYRRGAPAGGSALTAALAALGLFVHRTSHHRAMTRLAGELASTPPLPLLFLHVFSGAGTLRMLTGAGALWRFLGPLRYLEGGAMMTASLPDIATAIGGKAAKLITRTRAEVDATIARWDSRPSARWGMFATQQLKCSDVTWKYALDRLRRDAAFVVMDLSGFSDENSGCIYELGLLLDEVDTGRLLLLADPTTDVAALTLTLEQCASRMSSSSPNRRSDPDPIRIFQCAAPRTAASDGSRKARYERFVATSTDAIGLMRELLGNGA